jgi:hypothetical protein
MRVYVSGPMTGMPLLNRPAFAEAARRIRLLGFDAVDPAVLSDLPDDAPHHVFMRRDIGLLLTCDAIAMLPGWHASRGATLERDVALGIGLRILHLPHV